MSRRVVLSSSVCFLHALLDFKQPSASGDTVAFEGGRDGKADGLIRPALIRDNEVCVHRIKSALTALNRSIEALEVDCDISSLLHAPAILLSSLELIHIEQHFYKLIGTINNILHRPCILFCKLLIDFKPVFIPHVELLSIETIPLFYEREIA